MKILITGVAGLLGSRLADYILDHTGHEVVGIDDLSGGYVENVHPNVKFYKFNLLDHEQLDGVFIHDKPDIVYHFAAYAAEGLSPFIRRFNYNNNLVVTSNVVNNCIKHDIKKLVFTSTMAVYGHGKPPFDENDQPAPIDPYGIAKYSCEQDIRVAGEQHGLNWCIIRPHNVYGIKQNIWDKYRNVLGIWMYQHINNMPMTIFGDGEQKRAFSYIGDCIEPLWKAGIYDTTNGEIINLGSTKYVTINQANSILTEVFNGGSTVYKEQRHEVKHAVPTWQKSVDLLGYEDKTDLKTGLTFMWEWAQTQPNRNRFEWPEYELEKGIYDFWKK